jgi:hypothetical protein
MFVLERYSAAVSARNLTPSARNLTPSAQLVFREEGPARNPPRREAW